MKNKMVGPNLSSEKLVPTKVGVTKRRLVVLMVEVTKMWYVEPPNKDILGPAFLRYCPPQRLFIPVHQ